MKLHRYTATLFTKGYSKKSDLYNVPSNLKSKELGEQLDELTQKQLKKQKKISIFLLLFKLHGFWYFLLGLSQVILKSVILILRPILVGRFASTFDQNQLETCGLYGFSIIFLVLVECWYDQWYAFKLTSLEIRIRASIISLFYRKCLRLSSLCFNNVGKITTLVTKDVYNLEMCIRTANDTWISTIQTMILIYVLVDRMGNIVLILVLLHLTLLPMQIRLALKTTDIKKDMLEETDKRLQTTRDILSNIRIIKMYSWEKFFQTKLLNLRSKETDLTFKIFLIKFIIYINGIVWTCAIFFPWTAMFIFFGNKITSEIVFFMFDIQRTMGRLLTITIPFAVAQIAQTVATINRINNFMMTTETQIVSKTGKGSKISLKNVSAVREKESLLNDINLEFDKNWVLITGNPGSGKSFLLMTILGECEITRGSVSIAGSISYSSQQPWIFPATLRQNIIFGEQFDEKRYNSVLAVCDLVNDLMMLKNGDQTLIADGSLCKSRLVKINLARALYKDSDIYLLDDPLMSLDPHLKECILRECIRFLYNKLVLLVVQDSKDIMHCQSSVVINNGKIASCEHSQIAVVSTEYDRRYAIDDEESSTEDVNEETLLLSTYHPKDVYGETDKSGEVECKVYTKWMKAGGGLVYFFLLTFFLVVLPLATDFLEESVVLWSVNEEKIVNCSKFSIQETETMKMLRQRIFYITLHIFLIVMILVLTLGTSVGLLNFAKRASITLHNMVATALINVNLNFFHNSIAAILNKTSRDLLYIDEVIPFLFCDLFKIIIPMISSMIFNVPNQRIFLVPQIIILFILIYLKKIYLTVGRNLKRLEASSKNPVVGHLDAMLCGLTTVKSQNCQQKLLEEFNDNLDLHNSASFTYMCTYRAFSLIVGWTSTLFLGIVMSRFLVVRSDSASVAIITFQTLVFLQYLHQLFLDWVELEAQMTSVERVLALTQIKQEHFEGCLPEEWPKPGQIEFSGVSLHGTVLNNVSFVIHANEKIGVVGRSGSGKTALISTLFRLENFEGHVFINGIDSKMLPLELLRSKISVIPQDVVIFNGTIRENLDPLNKYTDGEIWEVLETVNLQKFVWDLDVNVYETYIVGRVRQILLFLARVLLDKNDFVVFDDFLTDIDENVKKFICDLIQTVFTKTTMLIVTYDLDILACCNKIFVLDGGRIVDFDTFSRLSRDEEGLFFKMLCKKSKDVSKI